MSFLLAAMIVAIVLFVVTASQRVMEFAAEKGYRLPDATKWVPAAGYLFLVSTRTFAQSTLDLELDLSQFWMGFNQFFNALFPPLAFIASIGAALGFIFLIIRALKGAFGGATN